MDSNTLQSIYAHASWANEKLFGTAAQIAEVQLTQAADDSESIFDLLVHVAELCADDLVEIIRYTNAKGEPQAYPRWQLLLHQALHAAQHRSEVALLLSQRGHSTGLLDYLIFIDETVGV